MDKTWMWKDRLTKAYSDGVDEFLKYALDHGGDPESIPCPCRICENVDPYPMSVVKIHLFVKGIDQKYTSWIWHGEEIPKSSQPSKVDVDVHGSQDYHFEVAGPDDAPEAVDMVQAAYEEFAGNPEKFQELIDDAEKPLYPGCSKQTKLSALVKLYNVKAKYGWSDKSFTKLLKELRKILPNDNNMPVSMYEAKKTLKALGMGYKKIHACPNDCVFFRKEYKDATICPTCGESRWKVNEKTSDIIQDVPAKVLWYFPPIPRFKRMFQSVQTAKDLTWHNLSRPIDGKLRHPGDGPAWQLVNNMYKEFEEEPRNLRLALSTDGINPHSTLSSRYSCWPVILVTYNLPPWLCMKRKFMSLTLLISGPKQPGNDIDVYLAPLIDDLKILWEKGVEVYDAYKRQKFNLRAVLLWTINDFPAYGNLCGCTVKGYDACPICGKGTFSTRLIYSKFFSYTGHRRFLPRKHTYRSQKAFNGQPETGSPPVPLSGEEIFDFLKNIKNSWGKKSQTLGKRQRSDPTYWKKKSIFFELEYWKYLLIRHILDVMHIEKNVCESIVGTLLNIPGKTKDGINARKDLADLRSELAPRAGEKTTYLPAACYTLSRDEKKKFCTTLLELKVPEGYSSNLRNCVSMSELKVYGLKSHDYHMLIQQFLPLAIRSIMPKHVRYAIIRLCFFFKEICKKEVDVMELTKLQKDLVVTLCLLEKYFPPSFFDVMIHLTVHLVREVKLCGPVYFRWMYPFERFMKILKGYVRNRNRAEGCMAECYNAEEAVEFCSEYLSGIETVGVPASGNVETNDENEEVTSLIVDGKPSTGGKLVDVERSLLLQAHQTVLMNTTVVLPYIEKHMSYLKTTNPKRKEKWLLKEHNRTFIDWIRKQVEEELDDPNNDIPMELEWITHGPQHQVIKYNGFNINKCRFNTKRLDVKRVNQNSGVRIMATGMHIASAKDDNHVFAESCFYGVIDQIWLLDYTMLRIAVFKCDWVDSANGIKKDELGFISVDLHRIGHKNDLFILASQAKQVFYVEDQLNPRWSVV